MEKPYAKKGSPPLTENRYLYLVGELHSTSTNQTQAVAWGLLAAGALVGFALLSQMTLVIFLVFIILLPIAVFASWLAFMHYGLTILQLRCHLVSLANSVQQHIQGQDARALLLSRGIEQTLFDEDQASLMRNPRPIPPSTIHTTENKTVYKKVCSVCPFSWTDSFHSSDTLFNFSKHRPNVTKYQSRLRWYPKTRQLAKREFGS